MYNNRHRDSLRADQTPPPDRPPPGPRPRVRPGGGGGGGPRGGARLRRAADGAAGGGGRGAPATRQPPRQRRGQRRLDGSGWAVMGTRNGRPVGLRVSGEPRNAHQTSGTFRSLEAWYSHKGGKLQTVFMISSVIVSSDLFQIYYINGCTCIYLCTHIFIECEFISILAFSSVRLPHPGVCVMQLEQKKRVCLRTGMPL